MGLGIAGLLSQVVKLEGDFVVGVKEAPVTQVSMLSYQNLRGTVKSSVSLAVRSGIIVARNDRSIIWKSTCLLVISVNFGKTELVHVVLGKCTVSKQNTGSCIYIQGLITGILKTYSFSHE